MTHRRKPFNWFRIILLILLIAAGVYVDRFVVPSIPPPFIPSPTATRAAESYITEAQGLFEQGKLLQAIDVYNAAIRIKPDNPTTFVALARVQLFAGKYDDALVNAEDALLLDPNNSMAHAIRGATQTQKGDYPNAEISIKRALQLDQNNSIAHAYYAELLGNEYLNNTGPLNAITLAGSESNLAIQLAPNSMEAHRARGFILEISDNREQAVQEYLAAIAINQFIPDLHLALGRTYKALGVTDKAIEQYTLANTLNPSDPTPDLYASRALAAIGEYTKASQYAEASVTNAPTDPYLRGNWGYMLYKTNEFNKAAIQFSLTVNGGTTEDGQTIQPLALTVGDVWIARYYYTYAVDLAQQLHTCGDALPITQLLLSKTPDDPDAAYNANFVQNLCQNSLLTPSPVPTKIAITPTP